MKKLFNTPRLIFFTLALFCAGGILHYGIKSFRHSKYPILGEKALDPTVFENHKLAVRHWTQKGIRNAVLINFDAHDDIKKISEKNIERLRALLAEGDKVSSGVSDKDLAANVSDGNFVYAAAKLGIVKEVYWIIPTSFFQAPDRDRQLAFFLNHFNFQAEEINTFKVKDGCFKGRVDDIPFNLCEIMSLPNIKEPVLLSIDVDYVPVMAYNYDENLTASVQRTFEALFLKKLKIQDVMVAYSVSGGHISTSNRWVGDLIIDILGNSDIIDSRPLPDHYRILQEAETLYKSGKYSGIISYLFPTLEKDIYNPAVLMYLALALEGRGALEQSFNCVEKACRNDSKYCYGLCELGCKILDEYGLEAAEKYFVKAYQQNPEMAHSLFILAQAMQKDGRYEDALKWYHLFRDHNGPFPADFFIGESHLLKGDYSAALKYFNSGRSELTDNPHALSAFRGIGVITRAIDFYDKRGMGGYAEELRMSLAME